MSGGMRSDGGTTSGGSGTARGDDVEPGTRMMIRGLVPGGSAGVGRRGSGGMTIGGDGGVARGALGGGVGRGTLIRIRGLVPAPGTLPGVWGRNTCASAVEPTRSAARMVSVVTRRAVAIHRYTKWGAG